MTDKKERQNNGEDREQHFTGSPEEQLPDLEAEDIQEPAEENDRQKRDTDKDKEKDD
ncbi:hypothetical protein M4S82_07450 [Planococcus sp. MERTA32b]|nr:hypothetical protein [Planococcus sp. MER TA 32b]